VSVPQRIAAARGMHDEVRGQWSEGGLRRISSSAILAPASLPSLQLV
jgi:hypothetical protein